MPKPVPPLSGFDLAVLAERGIAAETALGNGLRTDYRAGALVIPFADLDGTVNCYAVRRPHHPPVRDGKPLKYIAPKGQPSRLYIPAGTRDRLRDPAADLLVTEGPLKALALDERGWAAT